MSNKAIIIEDEVSWLFDEALRTAGWEVAGIAERDHIAEQLIEQIPVLGVVLAVVDFDLGGYMPRGNEFVSLIKEKDPAVKVIGVSARKDLPKGADYYWQKGNSKQELRELLTQLLKSNAQ